MTYPHNDPRSRASKQDPDGLPYQRGRKHPPIEAENDELGQSHGEGVEPHVNE
jgi:hypothetical protein